MSLWPGARLPDLTGRLAIVTGANSGIGYYTALELAKAGADIVLACRSEARGEAAAARINAEAPGRAKFLPLDLADFWSVQDFAGRVKAEHGALDLLVNNAGVMALPARNVTAQGFEQQFGVNFLGHFLLTFLLLTRLMSAKTPRVIQLSSIAHLRGRIDFTDPQAEQAYHPWKVYEQSKLAMLIFAKELQRRSDAGGWGILSLAAHPGIAATELLANGPGQNSSMAFWQKLGAPFIQQSGEAGAWPTILAATDEAARPGAYYGPKGWFEFRGPPGLAKVAPQAMDEETGRKLWALAEQLTGIDFKPSP